MQTLKTKYLRCLARWRNYAQTEQGERTICIIGAIYATIAMGSAALLTFGILVYACGYAN